MGFKFEDLRVWQMASDISAEIDELTFSFPKREEYVLSPQIRRAADSIALNIAITSIAERKDIPKNLLNSAFELLSNPSAILFEIDTTASQIWFLKEKSLLSLNNL